MLLTTILGQLPNKLLCKSGSKVLAAKLRWPCLAKAGLRGVESLRKLRSYHVVNAYAVSWVSGVLFQEVSPTPIFHTWKLRHRMTFLNLKNVTLMGADLGFEPKAVFFLLGKLSP